MFVKVVTTITSEVEVLDGGLGVPEHSVYVETGGLPDNVAAAVVEGAARSLVSNLESRHGEPSEN